MHSLKNTVPNYAFVGSAVRTARLLPIGNFMSFPSEMIRTTTNIVQQGLKEMRHVPAPGVTVKGSNLGLTVTEVLQDGTERIVKNNAMDRGTYGTGFKRMLGMATFTTGIPIALTEAWEEGRIKEGDNVVLAAFGSGFVWGSALIRW